MDFSDFNGNMEMGLRFYRALMDEEFAMKRVVKKLDGQEIAIRLVHGILGDSACRLGVVSVLDELVEKGRIPSYSTEDRFRIAEAYIREYRPGEGESPEAQLAYNIGENGKLRP